MPRPIGLAVVCFLCSISGCEQSCAEIGIQAKNGTLLEHENLKEDRTQAKTSRYTINKVLYSVPCAYAREVFLLNLCFGLAYACFEPVLKLSGMVSCLAQGRKKQARTGYHSGSGLRYGSGWFCCFELRYCAFCYPLILIGSGYSPRFSFIRARERCAASSLSFRSITACAWLSRLDSSLSFSFRRRLVRTALFFPLRMRPP